MKEPCTYLFVYGTLLNKKNEFAAYLHQNCRFYAEGKFKGRLYDVGKYPGAVATPGGDNYVYGQVFSLMDAPPVLAQLDDYEGFGAGQPQPNEFVRQLLPVETPNELLTCWVYLYNLPVIGLRPIESGKYLV